MEEHLRGFNVLNQIELHTMPEILGLTAQPNNDDLFDKLRLHKKCGGNIGWSSDSGNIDRFITCHCPLHKIFCCLTLNRLSDVADIGF